MADYLRTLVSHATDVAQHLLLTPLIWTEQFYWLYLLTCTVLAWISYRLYERGSGRGFLAFLCPREIYLHPSARIDYAIYPINMLLSPLTAAFGIAVQTFISVRVGQALVTLHDGQPLMRGEWTSVTWVSFILGYTLAADLSVYLIHRLHHASSVLWPIHALHHSAQVLTPVTLFRKHPLWNFTANLLAKALTGLFGGIFVFVYMGSPSFGFLLGINTIYAAYNLCGANLRHSHIWLSWGRPLSHLFISPAMHQVHHDPDRMNHNYGEIFAIWDWLFGTLYIPRQRERFRVGLGAEGNPHDTVLRAYWVPLEGCAQALCAAVRGGRPASGSG